MKVNQHPSSVAPSSSSISTTGSGIYNNSSNKANSKLHKNESGFSNVDDSSTTNGIYPSIGSALQAAATSIYPTLEDDEEDLLHYHQQVTSISSQPKKLSRTNSSNPTTSTMNNNPSTSKLLYDSSSQLLSDLSGYVKKIPWYHLAKQFNQHIIKPTSSYVANTIRQTNVIGSANTTSNSNPNSNGINNNVNNLNGLSSSYLGPVLWSDFMFVSSSEDNPSTTGDHLFMVVAYTNGFQLFDVHDFHHVKEVITKRSDELRQQYPLHIINDLGSLGASAPPFSMIQESPPQPSLEQQKIEDNHVVEEIMENHEDNNDTKEEIQEETNFNNSFENHHLDEKEDNFIKKKKKDALDFDYFFDTFQRNNSALLDDNEIDTNQMLNDLDEEEKEEEIVFQPSNNQTVEEQEEEPYSLKEEILIDFGNDLQQQSSLNNLPTTETKEEEEKKEEINNESINSSIPQVFGPIKVAKLLSRPSKKTIHKSERRKQENNTLVSLLDYYPLVAIITYQEDHIIHFYSLKTQTYLDDICRIQSIENNEPIPIFQIITSEELFAVSNNVGKLYFYDPCTFDVISQQLCFPSPIIESKKSTYSSSTPLYGGVMASRKRWIAFASNNEITNSKLDFTTKINSSITEISWDVAKKAATGIYYLGDLGFKHVSKYISEMNNNKSSYDNESDGVYSSDPEEENVNSENVEVPIELKGYSKTAGIVEIRDIRTNKILLHFKAHNEPIVAMAFDKTGTLLCTAPISGQYLNVFQIFPNNNSVVNSNYSPWEMKSSSEKNVKLLYRLYRGLTSATIQDIHFSVNSKWVAACSARGTIHLYAINPTGGQIDPKFFCTGESYDKSYLNQTNNDQPIILNAITRIHDPTFGSRNSEESILHTRSAFQFFTFVDVKSSLENNNNQQSLETMNLLDTEKRRSTNIGNENVLVSLSGGMLSYYLLKPQLKRKEKSSATDNLSKTTVGTASSGVSSNSIDEYDLELPVELIARFDIYQLQHSSHQNSTSLESMTWDSLVSNKEEEEEISTPKRYVDELQDTLSRWISNVELETYAQPSVPLWSTGHFKFKTIKQQVNDNEVKEEFIISEDDYNQMSDLSKSLYIKISNPIPLHKQYVESNLVVKEKVNEPPVDKDTINRAMSTPMYGIKGIDEKQNVEKLNLSSSPFNKKKVSYRREEEEKKNISNVTPTIFRNETISIDSESEEDDEEYNTFSNNIKTDKNRFNPASNDIDPNALMHQHEEEEDEDHMKDSKQNGYSHVWNYFGNDNGKNNNSSVNSSNNSSMNTQTTQSSAPSSTDVEKTKSITPPTISLAASIHQDYFDDEEEELKHREQLLASLSGDQMISNDDFNSKGIYSNYMDSEEEVDDYFKH
ncbi:hypothetical protein ABK040_008812 [Willaertia magna]